jgi:dihydrodipicolinate synthase/N-acetylneuraminate lyase
MNPVSPPSPPQGGVLAALWLPTDPAGNLMKDELASNLAFLKSHGIHGVLAHFLHAANAADLPTYLYNFPELTGTRINVETVAAFAELAPMAGIKQSGQEFEYNRELIALGRDEIFGSSPVPTPACPRSSPSGWTAASAAWSTSCPN